MKKEELYLVVGLGDSGLSCIEFLIKKGARVIAADTRSSPPHLKEILEKHPDLSISLGKIDLEGVTKLVLSPGFPREDPVIQRAINQGIPVISDIELFVMHTNVPIIAITGSNGKSTVTTLLGEMARRDGINVGVGGNIGFPALNLLNFNHELIILELSSFQLQSTFSLNASVATILNVSADHLDRHKSLNNYQKIKQTIYKQASRCVINREDDLTKPLDIYSHDSQNIISFGLDLPSANQYGISIYQDDTWLAKGDLPLLATKSVKMIGQQNLLNALAAMALGESVGISLPAMIEVLKTFCGLPHRCEIIFEYKKVLWINDSKGTNVGATIAALSGIGNEIDGKIVAILGGDAKQADLSPLVEVIEKYCSYVILIGEAKEELSNLLKGHINCFKASSMREAVQQASILAESKDAVLLSPACASFDMFENFANRGQHFRQEVENMHERNYETERNYN